MTTIERYRASATAALLAALSLVAAMPAAGRDLGAPAAEFTEVEVATVGLAADRRTPVVLLRPPDGGEVIPIFIGPEQARSILLALREVRMPR